MRFLILALAAFALGGAVPGQAPPAPPAFPALTGRVVDTADLLAPADEAALTRDLAALERNTSDQLVVVTISALNGTEIATYTRALFNHWGIGHRGRDNGVVMLVVPGDHQMRIEVGAGLVRILTDDAAKAIIDRDMLPHFRQDEYPAGIRAGEAAMARLLIAHRNEPRRP